MYIKNAYYKAEDYLIMKHAKAFLGTEDGINVLAASPPFFNTKEKIQLFEQYPAQIKESTNGKATKELLYKYLHTNIGFDFSKQSTTIITGDNKSYKIGSILSPFKKNTIIVMGASWCGPCVIQERQLKDLYKSIHTSKISIIGIYLDENHQAFTKYIEKEKYPWPSYRINDGRNNPIHKSLGYSGVPINILLDANGKIEMEDISVINILRHLNITVPKIFQNNSL